MHATKVTQSAVTQPRCQDNKTHSNHAPDAPDEARDVEARREELEVLHQLLRPVGAHMRRNVITAQLSVESCTDDQ